MLLSCGNNNLEIKRNGSGYKIFVYSGTKKPVYEINCGASYEETKRVYEFTDKTFNVFDKINGLQTPGLTAEGTDTRVLDFNNDYRRLYFSLGLYRLSDFKNDFIKYGLIQNEWKLIISGSMNKNDKLSKLLYQEYGIIPISDFQGSFIGL